MQLNLTNRFRGGGEVLDIWSVGFVEGYIKMISCQ